MAKVFTSGNLKGLILISVFFIYLSVSIAQNAIVTENALTGNAPSEWDISGAGDLSIQGFATDISVNRGDTIHFKIKTDASAYTINIYRLGYYQGNGARKVGTGVITATLPQSQPADLYDASTGLTDCGNWTESGYWKVPANAVSGLYIARLSRSDNGGASHIVFVVRNDAGNSKLYFQTSDATWQAYNVYGGNSLYVGSTSYTSGHAAKVSYNRPFVTRNGGGGGGAEEDWLFNAEYPMIRWLERNGYDVSYASEVDADRNGNLILNHKAFLSVGHDEYWSAQQRANVEAARNAGVHLAFFSGNEIYWKTRWENSTDGSNTPYRTLVCYKEGTAGENVCGGKCDPLPNTWTGLWRDGCSNPTDDGCNPENALSGQISWDGTTGAIEVPATYKNLRFWRNTSVATLASGQKATLTDGTLGYEWDWNQYPASYPAGRILLSSTLLNSHEHNLSLYKHPSGALVFGAGTVQWSWGLDGNHDRGGSVEDANMQQATVNLFADMGIQPATLQSGLVVATTSTDTEAPISIITSPANGVLLQNGNGVTISGTASDNTMVANVEVSIDGGIIWLAATGTSNWTFSFIPAIQGLITIKSRAIDDSGNSEAEGFSPSPNVIIDTVSAPLPVVCPCSVFLPTDVPSNPRANDGQPIEIGAKFQVTQNGFITGIRYYKGAGTTGLHRGHIWNNTDLLEETTFTNETASGWQEESFATPIPVVSGTTYLASYHSTSGDYPFTDSYFTQTIVHGPVEFLADNANEANGVYVYASEPAYPTEHYQSSNYWVDIVFNTTVEPDTDPPSIISTSPAVNATGANINSPVSVTFNEAIDISSLNNSSFLLHDASNNSIAATVSYNASSRTAILSPSSALAYLTAYTATVKGGSGYQRIKDIAGNAMAADYSWTFTTSSVPPPPPPPPTDGRGGPILVLSSASNPFSRYPVEILRAEGLNEFYAMDITQVTAALLNSYEVIVLGQFPLSVSDVTMLTTWVNAGGTLIAMRPDAQLASLLGITPTGSSMADKYLLVANSGAGTGIVNQTIQYHSAADLYTLNGATSLATLYSNASTFTNYPAVTTHSVGTNGGQAIAFAYDLARSVVYTRQGNPAQAGQKLDGQIDPIRSDDQFYPDWIDFTKIAIPQADEQQHLLSNIIIKSNLHRKPLPKFWFLPKGLKAAIVMTGDDHGDAGMQPRFDIDISESTPGCSVDDWDCIRSTGYLYVGPNFTNAMAQYYSNLGFEVALHVNTNCANFTKPEFENFITSQFASFSGTFPSISLPQTNRNHCIAWSDWSTTAEVEAAQGIRFDVNYYYWPGSWVNNQPGMFTGSGIPMRFAKMDGTLIDCYQAVTQMPDESGESFPQFCDALLDKATGTEGYYGVFTTNMHFDQSNHPGANAIVASAKAHHIPVVTAKQMLDWVDGRNNSTFNSITWNEDTLHFAITAAAGSRNMQAMIPSRSSNGRLTSVRINNNPVSYSLQTIKGIEYAFIAAPTGNYDAIYSDSTELNITALTATPTSSTTATVTWNTDYSADSHVAYGTSTSSLNQNAGSGTLVTSHSINLSGLTAGTTYYYRATSINSDNDSATAPVVSLSPQSFVTLAGPCAQDATAADFTLGTLDANTTITNQTDGEVTLKPAFSDEFAGSSLSANWQSGSWNSGSSINISGGMVNVDGAYAATTSAFSPKHSLEFVATFQSATFQNVGFAADASFNAPWITIGQGGTAGALYARSDQGASVTLGSGLVGTSHRYRIDWSSAGFSFYVDGVQTATIVYTVNTNMVAMISDYSSSGGMLQVDWLHVIPYAHSGSYNSRVFDNGNSTDWGNLNWNGVTPTGTTISAFVRTGNTSVPDGTWSGYLAVANGSSIGATSRYLQYRADLSTTDSSVTPILQDISITCSGGTICIPPTASISAVNSNVCFGGDISLQLDNASGQPPYSLVVNNTTYSNVTPGQTFAVIKPTENSIWGNTGTPANANGNDGQPIETGTKFKSSVDGYITGIRFYKGASNTGTHIASLWSTNGLKLATVPFTSETASGWQEVHFAAPVYIKADTVYIASYFSPGGTFAISSSYFGSDVVNAPLTALKNQNGVDGPNGVYKYGGGFPNGGNGANYWVDVLFMQEQSTPQTINYLLTNITDNNGCSNSGTALSTATATINPLPNGTISSAGNVCKGQPIALVFNATAGTGPFNLVINDSTYNSITSGVPFISAAATISGTRSIWSNSTIPGTASVTADNSSVELGVKFMSAIPGKINGIRFYKGSTNTGAHTGSLWSSSGTLLATASFTNETATGWQQVQFSNPVNITANTTYVASYLAPVGNYAHDGAYFNDSIVNYPLIALKDGSDGPNGVYKYGSGGLFPNNTYNASNYWVDVLFSTSDSVSFTLNQIADATNCGWLNSGNTIEVKLNPVYNQTTATSICSGSNYTFPDGTTQNNIIAATTHTSNLQSVKGCDSIIVTTVNVNPAYNYATTATVCSGSNYIFPDGTTQSNIIAATSHTSNLRTIRGCDSIIVTTVNVNPSYHQTISASVCFGNSYTFIDGTTQNNITTAITHTNSLHSKDGCDSIIVTTVNVNQLPNVTAIASQTSVCAGSSVSLTGNGANTYLWSGGVIDGNTFTPGGTASYTVTGTDGNGCRNTATQTITVNPLPVAAFGYTGFPYCTNSSNPSPSFSGGGVAGTFTSSQGLSLDASTGNVNLAASTSGTYTVTNSISAYGGCSSVSATAQITINPIPIVGITASSTTVCSGSPETLTGGGATTYSWSGGVNNGVSFVPIGTDTYTVTGTNNNGCINTASVLVTVTPAPVCQNGGTVNAGCGCNCPSGFTGALCQTIIGCTSAPAPPTIAGPTGYCGMAHPVFTASSTGATSYTWTVPAGVTSFTGQGTSSISTTMSGTSTGSGILTLTVTATNGCGTSTVSTFNTAKKPLAPIITGSTSICGQSTAAFSASSMGATSYNWVLPTGLTISSGGGTGNIVVNVAPSFISGNISVSGVNACGSIASSAVAVYAKAPSVPSSITGPTSVCGLTTATYTSATVPGATSYFWSLPSGFTGTSTTNSITVAISGYTGGNISAAGVNACGTGAIRTLVLTQAATEPSAIKGPTITCGLTNATYSIASVAGATGYNWIVPAPAIITGQGTTSITASFTSPISGNVTVTSNNGCVNSIARTLAISKLEPTPGVISGPIAGLCARDTATYSIAAVAGATGYNWLVPTGMIIASGQGTTSIFVNSATTSSGTVKVAAKNTCGTGTSASLAITCLDPIAINSGVGAEQTSFFIYPNPASNEFTISIEDKNYQLSTINYQLEVYDILGKMVIKSSIVNAQSSINIEQLNKGMYFVKLIDGSGNAVYTQKLIKE